MLICFDIDGTLIDSVNHSISKSTIKALKALHKNNHKVIIATGRSMDSLARLKINEVFEFDGYVGNNGQFIYDANFNIIYETKIPEELVLKTLDVAKQHNIPLALKAKKRFISVEANENVIRACQFFNNPIPPVGKYTGQDVGAMIAYGPLGYDYQEFKAIKELDVMVGESSYSDIALKGVSKATGIKHFCKLFNCDCYIAFGDSLNDYQMFKHASYSICMGQGNEELKKISNYVTDPIDQDGVYNACVKLKYIKGSD